MSNTLSDYDKELDVDVKDPQLAAECEAYANGPRHEKSSAFNLETLAQYKEENCDRVKQYQFEKQEELKRIRQGRVIHWCEFLRLLNTIIPAKYTGLARHGMTALRVFVPTVNGGEWQFICGVQAGFMHEYSTMYFDAHNLPTSEMYRGWRTVLLRLLLHGCVNDEQLDKVFGRASGPEAPRYLEQAQHIRNRG